MQKHQPANADQLMKSQPGDNGAWMGLAWMLASSVILILVGLGLCFCRLYDKPKPVTDGLAVATSRALVSDPETARP